MSEAHNTYRQARIKTFETEIKKLQDTLTNLYNVNKTLWWALEISSTFACVGWLL